MCRETCFEPIFRSCLRAARFWSCLCLASAGRVAEREPTGQRGLTRRDAFKRQRAAPLGPDGDARPPCKRVSMS